MISKPRRHSHRVHQRGVATLAVSLIVLFIISLFAFYVARTQLFETKTSSNQYRYSQAFEAAEAGLEAGVAWLRTRAESVLMTCSTTQPVSMLKATWGCKAGQTTSQCNADPYEYINLADTSCNSGAPSITGLALADNSMNVTINFRRLKGSLANLFRIEVVSVAQSPNFSTTTDPFKSQATVSQIIVFNPDDTEPGPVNPNAPIIVKNGVQSVTGTPDICPDSPSDININQGNRPDCTAGTNGTPGVAIATLQATTTGYLNPGHFDTHGGSLEALNAPTSSVQETLFGDISEADIKKISEYQYNNLQVGQRTVFYYGTGSSYGNAPNNFSPVGSATSPAIVYFASGSYSGDNCPKPSPGVYYGIIYMGGDCRGNGWGNVDIYGTLGVEGDLSQFSANTITRYFGEGDDPGGTSNLPERSIAKLPGSWKDF